MRRKKINRNGWYFKTLEKPIAFSFLTPGLPTEWTHFLLWFQLLPVIIQVSNLLTLAPGAYSHLLTKHLKLDAPSASNSKCPGLNYHFTSKLTPITLLLVSSNGITVTQWPKAESFFSTTSTYNQVLWPWYSVLAVHLHIHCFDLGIPYALS